MKKFFKFTTAAAALVALASCSNEDVFNQNPSFNGPSDKGTLTVNVEPLSDGVRTRALSNEDLTAINFEATDKIKVYDDELHRWDGYQFNKSSKKFELFTESDLTAPQFALYPFGQTDGGYEGMSESGDPAPVKDGGDPTGVIKTAWTKGGVTTATMRIPAIYTYKESALTDGTNGYWCNLPMWGTVSSTEGKLETDLKYMTAVLRVALKNVTSSTIDHLRIQAFKDESRTKQISLSGEFDAVLDTENPANTALKETLGNSDIVIDLSDADNADSYVFVPIVPCTNAIVVIKYEDATNTAVAGKDGKTEKVLSQKNYVRGTLYKAKGAEFEVTLGAPSAISKVLTGAKAQTEPVEVSTTVETETSTSDNVITIPSGMTADITLDLTGINTTENALYIEDENSSNPYAGNLTVVTAAATTGSNKIITQLKGAAVKFVGDYTATPFDVYAKELVIGEAEKTSKATIKTLGSMVEAITVAKDATVPAITAPAENALAEVLVEGTVTGAITANTNEKVATAVTVDGGTTANILTTGAVVVADGTVDAIGSTKCYANSLTVSASDTKAATISGNSYVNGNVSAATVGTGAITMAVVINKSEKTDAITLNFAGNTTVAALNLKDSKSEATITFADKAVATGNINAPLATINLKSEQTFKGNITATYLSLSGKAKHTTGTITTGKLVIQGEASVESATASNNVYVKLSKEGEAISGTLTIPAKNTEGMQVALHNGYIKEINLSAATKDVALKTSAGYVAIARVTEGSGDDAAKLVPAAASEWNGKAISDTYASNYVISQIWTASQLATIDKGGDGIRLRNDINLKGLAWNMPALKTTFNGADHTISGLAATAGATGGAGLFSTVKAGSKIMNLTVKDATITSAGKSNVGVLAASAAGAITIQKVTVSATMNVTGDADNVGGLIGSAAGVATIGQEGKATDVAVTLSALAGRYNLGGLIGSAAGAVIKKTTVAITNGITFTPTKKEPTVEDASNPKAGSIGMYIGNSTDNVTVDAVNPAANDQIKTKRAALGFKLNFSGTAPNISYYLGGKYTEIGLLTADKTLKIGETTVTSKSSDNVYEGTGDDKKACINWGGNGTSGSNVANATHGIYVASKAYAATDVK